jgi:LmbE family N-acetylglucosaminyl deacetylase
MLGSIRSSLGAFIKETLFMARRNHLLFGGILLGVGFLAGVYWHTPKGVTPEAEAAVTLQTERAAAKAPADDGKLRIIAFGAHPDDCEIKVGGTAAKWAEQGHHVKFVSVTNGDIGHWRMAGGPLALRRLEEVQRAAKILGIHTEVLDNHDGELEPTLANRRTITRLIRDWQADLVLAHRPNDYHPDHRYTGLLIQDAAYMVIVPYFCPDIAPLKKNPVFMYYSDRFQRPNPFRADMVVPVDDVIEKKLAALDVIESQFFEGGAEGSASLIPRDESGREARRKRVRQGFMARDVSVAAQYRAKLNELMREGQEKKTQHAEAFEICEYGQQPNKAQLLRLYPFFGSAAKTNE